MSIKLDQFAIVGVKESRFGSRVVQVKGLPKKEYTFNELYQLLKSQKGKQEETALKTALSKVLESDGVSKKGLIELVLDGSVSAMTPITGKEEAEFFQEILSCIRENKVKDKFVLRDVGMTLLRGILFKNSNQFMLLKETFPSNVMNYEQYGVVRKVWLKLCESIYLAVRNSNIQGKKEILKSLYISCDRVMVAFSEIDRPNYHPVEKILNPLFFDFLRDTSPNKV